MHQRAADQAAQQQKAFDAYVKETAGTGADPTQQLAKLADLKQQGVITDAEFESQRRRSWPEADNIPHNQPGSRRKGLIWTPQPLDQC
jgi:hypothetical protein